MDKEDNIRSINGCESEKNSTKQQEAVKILYSVLNDINDLLEDKS